MMLDFITWNVDPELLTLGPITIRWYGLCFALAFAAGYKLMEYIYKREGLPEKELDKLAVNMIIAVIIGARLGHVLFYQPDYYLENPIEILKIWEGGLASHGAAIAILIALFLYSRRKEVPGYQWILDRIIIAVPIGGFFVRIGNLMNSEIYGKQTDLPWGFIFVRDPDSGMVPRHPTQIYEALGYFLIFALLFILYRKQGPAIKPGRLFGLFLIMLFGLRFFVEFLKKEQVEFEQGMALNMGQLLSIPFIAVGIFILIRSYRLVAGEKI